VPRTSHGPVAAQAVVIGALLLAIAAGACGGTEEGTTRPVEKSYPSGVVRTRGTEAYFDGKWRSHGEFVYFDEDGDETHRGAFERGLETGPWTERGADGSLGKGVYLEGERHGPWAYFHANGKYAERGSYERGKRVGEWVRFHPNQREERRGHYRDGVKVGVWQFWSHDGEPLPEKDFGAGSGEPEK
jgi:antitoxin component YwqK of YwqJK toxin-antitoxin module